MDEVLMILRMYGIMEAYDDIQAENQSPSTKQSTFDACRLAQLRLIRIAQKTETQRQHSRLWGVSTASGALKGSNVDAQALQRILKYNVPKGEFSERREEEWGCDTSELLPQLAPSPGGSPVEKEPQDEEDKRENKEIQEKKFIIEATAPSTKGFPPRRLDRSCSEPLPPQLAPSPGGSSVDREPQDEDKREHEEIQENKLTNEAAALSSKSSPPQRLDRSSSEPLPPQLAPSPGGSSVEKEVEDEDKREHEETQEKRLYSEATAPSTKGSPPRRLDRSSSLQIPSPEVLQALSSLSRSLSLTEVHSSSHRNSWRQRSLLTPSPSSRRPSLVVVSSTEDDDLSSLQEDCALLQLGHLMQSNRTQKPQQAGPQVTEDSTVSFKEQCMSQPSPPTNRQTPRSFATKLCEWLLVLLFIWYIVGSTSSPKNQSIHRDHVVEQTFDPPVTNKTSAIPLTNASVAVEHRQLRWHSNHSQMDFTSNILLWGLIRQKNAEDWASCCWVEPNYPFLDGAVFSRKQQRQRRSELPKFGNYSMQTARTEGHAFSDCVLRQCTGDGPFLFDEEKCEQDAQSSSEHVPALDDTVFLTSDSSLTVRAETWVIDENQEMVQETVIQDLLGGGEFGAGGSTRTSRIPSVVPPTEVSACGNQHTVAVREKRFRHHILADLWRGTFGVPLGAMRRVARFLRRHPDIAEPSRNFLDDEMDEDEFLRGSLSDVIGDILQKQRRKKI